MLAPRPCATDAVLELFSGGRVGGCASVERIVEPNVSDEEEVVWQP
jgi:hypothetical protein